MDTSNLIIETKNLYLKGITMEYKENIFKEFTAEITTHMFPKTAESIKEIIDFIDLSIKQNNQGSNFQAVILNKKNKEFLGGAGLHHIDKKFPEFGIWIKKSAQGKGYGKEAIIALKEWADKNINYEYLLYPVVEENHPSRRISRFLGGKIYREYDEVNMSGKKQHLLEYRIYPKK